MSLSKDAKAAFAAILSEPVLKGFDTKTKREHREQFEKSYGKTTPTAELASKIEAANSAAWISRAYVLLVRDCRCKNCGVQNRVLDSPRLYLEQHRVPKDDSNPIRYTAVKAIEYHNLPRRKVISFAATPYCLECFECQTSSPNSSIASSPSVLADIKSLIEELGESPLVSAQAGSGGEASSSSSTSPSQSITTEVEFGGSPLEKEFGLGSERGNDEQPVHVEG